MGCEVYVLGVEGRGGRLLCGQWSNSMSYSMFYGALVLYGICEPWSRSSFSSLPIHLVISFSTVDTREWVTVWARDEGRFAESAGLTIREFRVIRYFTLASSSGLLLLYIYDKYTIILLKRINKLSSPLNDKE